MVNYLNGSLADADQLGGADSSFWGEVSRKPLSYKTYLTLFVALRCRILQCSDLENY